MTGPQLDAGARLALDVALGTAGAMGDERCGTEYLLFGVVATAQGGVAEMLELFALDTLRVERAVRTIRGDRGDIEPGPVDDPPLSPRAQVAVHSQSRSGAERRNSFDLLVGMVQDPRSGAATVLRHLGVRIGEVRRLAELGAARLGDDEVKGLIDALDRRSGGHMPWWGPVADAPAARVALPNSRPLVVARSESAVVSLDGVVAGAQGFGFTLAVVSCGAWLLPPAWDPPEDLLPGFGSTHRVDPDVVTIDVRYDDGTLISNRRPESRWSAEPPDAGALVKLGTRTVVDDRNDRRAPARRSETSEWWVWPLPPPGLVTVLVEWRAEALRGSVEFVAGDILEQASGLGRRR